MNWHRLNPMWKYKGCMTQITKKLSLNHTYSPHGNVFCVHTVVDIESEKYDIHYRWFSIGKYAIYYKHGTLQNFKHLGNFGKGKSGEITNL